MISFYKPNSRNTGSGCSFKLSLDNKCIYLSLIKQFSTNGKRGGSFSENAKNPKASVVLKLNQLELAAMLDSLESNSSWNTFHPSERAGTGITFEPYLDKESGAQKGFSLRVNRELKPSGEKFGIIIAFKFDEMRLLKQFLIFSLNKLFQLSLEYPGKNEQYREEEPAVENFPSNSAGKEDYDVGSAPPDEDPIEW